MKFLSLLNQIKTYHLQTRSYAEHQALGGLYDTLDGLIDTFLETYSGRYNEVPKAQDLVEGGPKNYASNAEVVAFLDEAVGFLENDVPYSLEPTDTELLNIRDEMLSAVNHAKYLMRLK